MGPSARSPDPKAAKGASTTGHFKLNSCCFSSSFLKPFPCLCMLSYQKFLVEIPRCPESQSPAFCSDGARRVDEREEVDRKSSVQCQNDPSDATWGLMLPWQRHIRDPILGSPTGAGATLASSLTSLNLSFLICKTKIPKTHSSPHWRCPGRPHTRLLVTVDGMNQGFSLNSTETTPHSPGTTFVLTRP